MYTICIIPGMEELLQTWEFMPQLQRRGKSAQIPQYLPQTRAWYNNGPKSFASLSWNKFTLVLGNRLSVSNNLEKACPSHCNPHMCDNSAHSTPTEKNNSSFT